MNTTQLETAEKAVASGSASLDYTFGVLELASCVVGFTLNSASVGFFYRKRRSPTYLLYLIIAIVDILTCVTCFPSGISMLYRREPVLLSPSIVCVVTGWIFNITTRMSVYLVAVLSVIRCITLSPSMPSPKIRHAVIPVIVYLLIQVFQASLPLLFSTHSPSIYFAQTVGSCSWGIDDLSFAPYDGGNGTWYRFTLYFCLILPSFLPLFPVVVSCIIFVKIILTSSARLKLHNTAGHQVGSTALSVTTGEGGMNVSASSNNLHSNMVLSPSKLDCSLGKNGSETKKNRGVRRQNVAQQATTTMYIVTALYIIFNVPFWSFTLAIIFFKTGDHIVWLELNAIYVHIFLSRTSVVMNAACNPLVYFTRITELRRRLSLSRFLGWTGRKLRRGGSPDKG